ncbi:MarR family winged helix-turn-helix transcriptional regulator [Algisphaera agarilytica]|uniref:DNA-binding MarR family transcriptional regulator n=1 Tax=Algisphaera agarilytica TaxID=1385975 RepID=A0A7X0LK66_9BACT|nr:MarR family transcriptional regulator [Algisphaera agarilytica]MBB6429316.1 DNA-binding MarR family transcriptional regulator [Algisphaera agarilytica]
MFDRCVYFNLTTLTRKITRIWQDEFGRLGLSPSHGYLLKALSDTPGATQKDLSAAMELDASTITRFIDALSRQGLIEKSRAGKGAQTRITPAGRDAVERVEQLMDNLYLQMQGTFGKAELESFVGGLRQARNNF